jgi:hypothetical protein
LRITDEAKENACAVLSYFHLVRIRAFFLPESDRDFSRTPRFPDVLLLKAVTCDGHTKVVKRWNKEKNCEVLQAYLSGRL